jgi:hypothetical protein
MSSCVELEKEIMDWTQDTRDGCWTFADVRDVSTPKRLLAAITWKHSNGLVDEEITEATVKEGSRLHRIVLGLLGHVNYPQELYDLIGKRTRSIELVRRMN